MFVDLDERRNRVTIAVATEAAAAAVRQTVGALGVPGDAIHVFIRKPIRVRSSGRDHQSSDGSRRLAAPRDALPCLTSRMRPVEGGVKISIPWGGSQSACSLSVNAYSGTLLLFLTASHCTNVRGGPNDTRFSQSDYISGPTHDVGTEYQDPAWTTSPSKVTAAPCPAGYLCRDSDAALVRYADPSPSVVRFGYMARTTYYGTGTGVHGSTEVDGSNPRWQITAKTSYPSYGDKLHKEGFVSGWTWGTAEYPCIDLGQNGTSYHTFCQDLVVGAAFAEGDSGSGVFAVPGTAESTAITFYGVAWGGTDEDTAFSAVYNIEADLGVLRVH